MEVFGKLVVAIDPNWVLSTGEEIDFFLLVVLDLDFGEELMIEHMCYLNI